MDSKVEGPQDLASLQSLLQKEAETRRKKAESLQQLIFGLAGGYVAVAVILFIIKGKLEVSSFLSFTSLFACLAAGVSMTSQHRKALSQASQWKDPRVIPHMIEALDADQDGIKQEAKSALAVLLPLALQNDAPEISLTAKQRQLLTSLCRDKDEALAGNAVRSLATLGDETSLKTLDEIGRSGRIKAGPTQERLAALALESAGDLRLRLARQMVEQRKAVKDGLEEDLEQKK